jgi:hypothetical protein
MKCLVKRDEVIRPVRVRADLCVGYVCPRSKKRPRAIESHRTLTGRGVWSYLFQAFHAWLPSFIPTGRSPGDVVARTRRILFSPITNHFSPITGCVQISQVNAVSARSMDASRGLVAWRTACMPPITLLSRSNPSASRMLAAIELR